MKTWWPDLIPLDTWSLWDSKGTNIGDWMKVAWPIFAWGIGVNILFTFIRSNDRGFDGFRHYEPDGMEIWIKGGLISLWAGITEEIAFRWLIFLSAIATVRFGNFLFFGWAGFGLPEWFHSHAWGPLANWSTFDQLEPYIFSEHGWAVGAALLYSNAFFRDGHKYQGLFGVLNSWFCGMFFFWVTFNYGLLAAIVIHVLYDFAIFTYAAVYTMISDGIAQRRRRKYSGY